MKKMKRCLALVLTFVLMLTLSACGGKNTVKEPAADSVNIAVTDTLGSLNPLLQDGTEVVKYAQSLTFLPLVELNENMEFVSQLAKEITTEDNIHFNIYLDENARWSDGEAITADDVLFTFLCWASPEVGNTGMSMFAIEGVGDDGYVAPGSTEISGIKKISDTQIEVTMKWETALYTFENVYGRYILILPEHILGDIPRGELLTHEWFNAPTVISGPYFIKEFDLNHYVHYEANENYWMGAPKIKYLNINVLQSSQLLAGLQAEEIDVVQQSMGNILLEDYEGVRALENVTIVEGTPITTQSIFFNVENVPDVRIRQAFLYAMNREKLVNEFLQGNGEVVDGFLASASPFYDSSLGVIPFDLEKARDLVAEAVADGTSNTLTFYVNSGDTTFVNAASYLSAMYTEIGLDVQVKTVDLATLLTVAGEGSFDVMAVQYTYAPVDAYTDASWHLSESGWTKYVNEEVNTALALTQSLTDEAAIAEQYLIVDQYMQTDVPMINAYVISALGAVSNRMVNVKPNVYGTFINVHQWEIKAE